ncbi:MAG: leucyl aminopeptidase [Candidatus Obscuribacterales bacterium]|nr:leucyl aminopeptidase [Candidatus Obscuribacterales bacterium]
MKVKKLAAVAANVAEVQADLLLVPVFEGGLGEGAALQLQGSLSTVVQQATVESFTGKSGETMFVFSADKIGATRTLFFGLGSKSSLDRKSLRDALTAAFSAAKAAKVSSLALACPELTGTGVSSFDFGQAAGETVVMVDYVINHFKTALGGHKPEVRFDELRLVCDKADKACQNGLKKGFFMGESVNKARDFVNLPPNMMTPMILAKKATEIAKNSGGSIKVKIIRKRELKKQGWGAFLAVAQGSDQEPVFIDMVYEGEGATGTDFLTFIGKSVTYDSGGLDVKTGGSMRTMKCDMAGGATTLAAIMAVAALKLPLRLRVVMAATENMINGSSYKSGDVLFSLSGMSIEVDNTDAEGRLTLADAIEYCKRNGATHIVDVATLTGAMVVGLGKVATGAFSNNDQLAGKVLQAADVAGEHIHRMPMHAAYAKGNESNIADVKNSGGAGFGAGSITAAWFLRKFVGETLPWVHLDIAGTAFNNNEASGWGVRTLIELARDFATPDEAPVVPSRKGR